MKFLATLTLLAVSTASFAADRAIYDVQYLPKAGTTYGFSELEYLKRDISGKSGVSDTEISGYGFTQTIGHAFTDRFSVEAALGYGNFEVDTDGEPKTEQTGVNDPTVIAKFRLMDEAFRWDIGAGVLISRGDSEIKSDGDTDNLQGGNAVFLGTSFGQKTEAFQWAIQGTFTRNMERTFDTTGGDADADANNELEIRADFLNKLAEKSLLRYFVAVDFSEILESDDTAPETISAPTTTYTVGGEYQHLFSQDFMGRVGLDYNMINSDSAYTDSDNAWRFRVAANYQF